MDYKFDIFLSYPQGFIQEWLDDTLLPLLNWHLQEYIGYIPKIFIDRDGISTGDDWPLRLKQALCYSKCLVPLWCPSYFSSDWCLIECLTMKKREEENGLRSIENPSGLIFPLNVSDGDYFPNFAKKIQYFDLRDYVLTGEGFKASLLYVEVQQKIKKFAKDVGKCIQNTPKWDSDWLNKPNIKTRVIKKILIKPPYL